MSDYLRLTPIDWQAFSNWSAAYRMAASSGDLAPFWSMVVNEARPYHVGDPEEPEQPAVTSPDARLLAVLQRDPRLCRDEFIERYRYAAEPVVDWLLRLLSRAARDHVALTETDAFLAFFSESYRRYVVGAEMSGEIPEFDGPRALLEALGRDEPPHQPRDTVHPAAAVLELASRLDAIDPARYPEGDIAALIDYVELYVDPNLAAGGESFNEIVLEDLRSLQEHYRSAAARGFGIWVRPPA
ncbi:MAG: hypothetical protein KIT09_33915 [Bryobacteraceae bacterium]|nr:hypothetical protein [Bryobacteraceae bacterium]